MTKKQLEDIQLPKEQFDPVTNWMADLPPLTKKPRANHPRQRCNNKNNIDKQRHLPKQHQQHQPGQQSHETIESQPFRPLQKKPIRQWFAERKTLPPQRRSPGNPKATRNAATRPEHEVCNFSRLLTNS